MDEQIPTSFDPNLVSNLLAGDGTEPNVVTCFTWKSTPQGQDFWKDVSAKQYRGTPIDAVVRNILAYWLQLYTAMAALPEETADLDE